MKLKPILVIATVAAALAAGAAVLLAKRSVAITEKAKPTPVATVKPALTVTITRPSTADLPITLSANGNIVAWQEASVGAEANGLRLTEVHVNVGDEVKQGQVLAKFAAETIQADVAQARASLAEAVANAQESAANGDRARRLKPTGAISAQQINQYLTAEQAGKARVQAARATLHAQQLRMQHTQVIAPDSGVISVRMATVGAVVGTGTELFRMIRQGRLEWRAEVMSEELGRMAPGAMATLTAANGRKIQGKVRMIAPTVDPQTRAALVYVDLPKDSGAKAGMFATGQFELGSSNALTVPQQAVVMRDGFTFVFGMNADRRVAQIKVATGRRLGDRVEITSGVTPDTVIVASGAGFLNDGDLVKDMPQAPAPTAAVVER